MIFAAIGHWHSFTYKDYNNYDFHFGRMTLPHAFRDALGLRDIVQDSRETYSGDQFNYRAFEPAEGIAPAGPGRNQRILAGLRYVDGGQTKYWIPSADSALKADPYLLQSQMDSISLDFPDVDDSDNVEDDYECARQLVHGDYNYPVITVSSPTQKPNENQSIKGKSTIISYSAVSTKQIESTTSQRYGNSRTHSIIANDKKAHSEESTGLLYCPVDNSAEYNEENDDPSTDESVHTEPNMRGYDRSQMEGGMWSPVQQRSKHYQTLHSSPASPDPQTDWHKRESKFASPSSQSSLYNPWS
ncbi:hypothetical protein K7432_003866 [Basidiobolus ranarum]|uniref:Uncharacterized protein n=1 Tax=Basidiobolus ranarum TaxID=34480 RepID=A0ABR2WZ47_9FUNG